MSSGFHLATRWAADLVQAVVPASRDARVNELQLGPIGGLVYRATMLYGESLNALHVRVRATFKILERGFDLGPESLGAIYDRTFQLLDALQERERVLAEAAWEAAATDPEHRFGAVFEYHQFLYERHFRTLAAPVVVADGLVTASQKSQPLVDSDGRVKLDVVRQIEAGQRLRAGALTQGLDNHLRNAKAHYHYDVVSDNSITLWDVNAKGAYTWGPVTLT